MKRVINFLMAGLMVASMPLYAQRAINDRNAQKPLDRMGRDIAVMETALTEMVKQEFGQHNYFFMEVKGSYMPGYGVTFTMPASIAILDGGGRSVTALPYNPQIMSSRETLKKAEEELEKAKQETEKLNAANNEKIINAAKTFIADYGDMLSQLAAEERIIVTNRGNNDHQFWIYGQKTKRSFITIEAKKADLMEFRQGKITRDQLLSKIKVINTVSTDKIEPDMELLTSIFNRLYRSDLSKTYYLQYNNVSYERLTDFGVILHMRVVSSIEDNSHLTPNGGVVNYYSQNEKGTSEKGISMPTLGLTNLTQEERDKKVKELYPVFESELKENMLDYGRTLKSLKDNEQLIVDVTLTKCTGCGIPATLELAVKASVLKDFSTGKMDKNAALASIEVRKGVSQ